MAAATWSAQTTWWRRSTMTVVKSSKPRSDASSCSMMFSCVPRPISGKSDKPDLLLISPESPLFCTFSNINICNRPTFLTILETNCCVSLFGAVLFVQFTNIAFILSLLCPGVRMAVGVAAAMPHSTRGSFLSGACLWASWKCSSLDPVKIWPTAATTRHPILGRRWSSTQSQVWTAVSHWVILKKAICLPVYEALSITWSRRYKSSLSWVVEERQVFEDWSLYSPWGFETLGQEPTAAGLLTVCAWWLVN